MDSDLIERQSRPAMRTFDSCHPLLFRTLWSFRFLLFSSSLVFTHNWSMSRHASQVLRELRKADRRWSTRRRLTRGKNSRAALVPIGCLLVGIRELQHG